MAKIEIPRRGSSAAEIFEIEAWCDLVAAAPPTLAAATGLAVERVGGAVCVVAPGIPSTEFNRAVGLGVNRPATAADIDAVIAVYRTKGIKTAWIQVMEPNASSGIESGLLAAGAQRSKSNWVMVERPAAAVLGPRCDLEVAEIGPEHALESGRVFRTAYGLPEVFDIWNAGLVGRPNWRVFGAFHAGRIVAVAYLYQLPGRAMLLGAATLPDHREQGAQSALMARRITEAQARDSNVVVQTHTGLPPDGGKNPSLNNMERLGFQRRHLRRNFVVGA